MRPGASPFRSDPELRSLLGRCMLFAVVTGVLVAGLGTAGRPEERLLVPVQGVPAAALRDSFDELREGGRRHRAIDIVAPYGTPVRAVDDGVVFRLDESPRGGIALYQWDARGERCFYYGHLARYRTGLEEGATVQRGETLGFVGSSGNARADSPHLHFEIHPARAGRCPSGEPVNPFGVLSGG